MEFNIIDIAVSYLQCFLSVFPLKKHEKTPAVKCWKQYRESLASPELFKAHDGNLGLITGHNGNLNLLAIDVDRTDEGIEQAKLEFVEKYGFVDWESACCQATPSGGRHYFFRIPDGIEISNRAGIIDGVDIRGEGGYVVISPSVARCKHTGELKAYHWLTDIPLHEAAEISVEVATAIAQSGKEKLKETVIQEPVPTQPNYNVPTTAYGAKALDGCISEMLIAKEGTRNDTLNAQAFNVGRLIGGHQVNQNDGYNGLVDAALNIGLSEQEAKATIASGIEAGLKEPRVPDDLTESGEEPNVDWQEWGDPQPFNAELEPVLPLSKAMLPDVIYNHAKIEVRKMDNTALDYAVMAIIACVSAVIGTTRMIRPKKYDFGWLIAPVLWCVAVGSPSTKKTPALKIGTSLLSLAQNEFDEEYTSVVNEVEADKAVNDLVIQNKEKDAKAAAKNGELEKAKTLKREIRELGVDLPNHRIVLVNDATIEAIAIRAESNPEGCLVFRDELSGLLAMIDRADNANDRAFYLEGFGGDSSYTQERVGRPNVYIKRLGIWIMGGIQPDKLIPYLRSRKQGEDNDGFIERMQYMVYPDHQGSEYIDEPTDPLPAFMAGVLFKQLADLKFDDHGNSVACAFTDEAQAVWDKWAIDLHQRQNASPTEWQAILGKYPALCAKFALIFHLCESSDIEVSRSALEMAIRFMGYIESHARRIHSYWLHEEQVTSAKLLLDKLDTLSQPFTKKSVADKNWKGLGAQERDKALKQLEKRGYIQRVEAPNPGGRPSVFFYKHPDYCQ
ncbi:DUF3987 domain-containing protein [uncultured Photobacterium sp.]|uniref:DUF3987 domain-containing protein n=1 Tax=uncultured Photobacterium sp. TaxID=173973 RepID=UPI0026048738|nr:DUF3987 domain-containing protein [uncultured Photobacterium sp.]